MGRNPGSSPVPKEYESTVDYNELVTALKEAVKLLNAWGPSPGDSFFINETALPLIRKYSSRRIP